MNKQFIHAYLAAVMECCGGGVRRVKIGKIPMIRSGVLLDSSRFRFVICLFSALARGRWSVDSVRSEF